MGNGAYGLLRLHSDCTGVYLKLAHLWFVDSILALEKARKGLGLRMTFDPPMIAISQCPSTTCMGIVYGGVSLHACYMGVVYGVYLRTLRYPRSSATREEEQAVSTVNEGPVKPKRYEILREGGETR